MLDALRKRLDREDEGFTLIELMVVVLIIAILLAIAIPTFLGARDRANDRAAQSSLRNAVTAAKTIFTDSQDYLSADTSSEMEAVEPSLTYNAAGTASTGFKVVSVATQDSADDTETAQHDRWAAAALSKSGKCFYIMETNNGTKYGEGTGACTGTQALASATADEF